MSNLVSVRLETVLVSALDRYTVCAKCTIGSEIVLDAPQVLLGYVDHVENYFGPFGDSASIHAR